VSGTTAPVVQRSELPVRIASGVAMIGVAVGALAVGGLWFWLLVTVAALLIAAEWAGMMRTGRARIALCIAGAAVPLLLVLGPAHLSPTRAAYAAIVVALAVALLGRSGRLGAGVLYAAWPSLALLHLRWLPDGITLALWTLAIVWATDIGAYFAGRTIGGPRLAPLLSPNKTWAGLIGGMVAALAVGFGLAFWFHLPLRLASLAGLLAVAAQCGDLFESWLKRRAGVKDSGRILPGHGGAMDRLDGVVPVACIVALVVANGWI
jgi:phosphatidate cytidylyltransferase